MSLLKALTLAAAHRQAQTLRIGRVDEVMNTGDLVVEGQRYELPGDDVTAAGAAVWVIDVAGDAGVVLGPAT